jgi:hypothetical protein
MSVSVLRLSLRINFSLNRSRKTLCPILLKSTAAPWSSYFRFRQKITIRITTRKTKITGSRKIARRCPELIEVWHFSEFPPSRPISTENILKLLASNYILSDPSIVPIYRKPFDVIAKGLSLISWLPGRDSNPRPIGYKCPDISARLGLSHHPPKRMSGALEVYWMGSSTSSLCTFLPTDSPSTGFAQDYRRGKWDFLLRLP